MKELPSDYISQNSYDDAIDRRGFLKCMAWAGTGLIWSVNGGILTSIVLGQAANNPAQIATADLNFVQISDSHIGFNKPANTDVVGTTREAIMRINAFPLPTPGSAPKPIPVVVEATQLKKMLGLTTVNYTETNHSLAVVDSTLE